MGAGALALYVPIIIKLVREGHADGFSMETWLFNIFGFTAGVLYPLKRGFPLSTYVDGLVLTTESVFIMGLICYYRGLLKPFIVSFSVYALALFLVVGFLDVPLAFITSLQVASIVMCNYANIPQIITQFKTRRASWSWITATMSTVGNSIKIFATKQLTGDRVILSGHYVGVATNAILLLQTIALGKGLGQGTPVKGTVE